ncbi:MAG: UDP-N-acetylmuramoyl-L-alanyl-D-glutamate--2,6-diaminopimelate ligase [Clostridia bacterium]|nr:UDP-N-acetylmuramoyl-L-alanyl-D-glutamate--2,6-diaminopimelate ligase [Clostridia bacterium]
MKLGELLKDVEYTAGIFDPEKEISGIFTHSDDVRENGMFIAIKGQHGDGHEYVNAAIEKGAAVIVTDKAIPNQDRVSGIRVPTARKAWAYIEHNRAGRPAEVINSVAVTGTNGKSSVTRMLRSIIEASGQKCAEFGTLGGGLTTPDPDDLYPALSEKVKNGCKWVVMEASSHALALDKLAPMCFDGAVFTNLTLDHTDFHGSMEAYGAAKAKLFSICRSAVVNYDDEGLGSIVGYAECPVNTFSMQDDRADFTAKNPCYGFDGFSFDLLERGGLFRVNGRIAGHFQAQNALAAASAARILGFDGNAIQKGIASVTAIEGRMMPVTVDGADFHVFIDYAHTPHALESVLFSARRCMNGKGRLIVIFGCGGERDKSKRAPMGKIASRFADLSIITADNSRSEDTYDIIRDILIGFNPSSPRLTIADRRQAIAYAIHSARKDDVLLFCGKGHEDYEIDASGRHPFNEREEILRAASQRIDLQ